MKTLMIIDRNGWAYNRIANAINKYGGEKYDVMSIKSHLNTIKREYKKYDSFFVMAWHLLRHIPFLPLDVTRTGIHSHHSWDGQLSTPDYCPPVPQEVIDVLGKCKGINAVSLRLTKIFNDAGLNVKCTPNGVDTWIFKSVTIPGVDHLIVGCTATEKHDWRKGVSEIVIPAAKKVGVDVLFARNNIEYLDMPTYYNKIDIYVCASKSEGMSLAILEAAACGRPVISTRVSGSEDIIRHEENGYLIDRSIDALADVLIMFKKDREKIDEMGIAANKMAQQNSWENRVEAWKDFLTT